MIGYGVCVGSWERFALYAPKDRPMVALYGQPSISSAYNKILNFYADKAVEAVILIHDDLEITDPDVEAKVLSAFEDPNIAVVGVDGGRDVTSIAWWEHSPIGHQMTDRGIIDFGQREGGIEYCDGSFIALSPWAIRCLRFDSAYGFHGYEDICLEARRLGKRVVAVDIDTHHHTPLGFRSEESHQEWVKANDHFRKKWGFA